MILLCSILYFFWLFILPCCLYALLFTFLIPAHLLVVNTINIVAILILWFVLFVLYCSFAHFLIPLHILYVHVTITLLESLIYSIIYDRHNIVSYVHWQVTLEFAQARNAEVKLPLIVLRGSTTPPPQKAKKSRRFLSLPGQRTRNSCTDWRWLQRLIDWFVCYWLKLFTLCVCVCVLKPLIVVFLQCVHSSFRWSHLPHFRVVSCWGGCNLLLTFLNVLDEPNTHEWIVRFSS